VVFTAAGIAVGVLSARHDNSPAAAPASNDVASFASLPAAPKPAFRIPAPRLLDDAHPAASWSTVLVPVTARSAPSAAARAVARLGTDTPEGTANVVLVLGRKEDARGRLWARVRLPVLPNGTTGWLPRSALSGYHAVRTHLVVDTQKLTATLWSAGRVVFRAPVGVGRPSWPTPTGEFYVRDLVHSLDSPFYGPVAFGTSARSAVLTEWPAGGFIGIHGTDEPDIIPGRVSHGCIRMRNTDILRLARLMPVGTPLTIV
jgi:hypothetical protein